MLTIWDELNENTYSTQISNEKITNIDFINNEFVIISSKDGIITVNKLTDNMFKNENEKIKSVNEFLEDNEDSSNVDKSKTKKSEMNILESNFNNSFEISKEKIENKDEIVIKSKCEDKEITDKNEKLMSVNVSEDFFNFETKKKVKDNDVLKELFD